MKIKRTLPSVLQNLPHHKRAVSKIVFEDVALPQLHKTRQLKSRSGSPSRSPIFISNEKHLSPNPGNQNKTLQRVVTFAKALDPSIQSFVESPQRNVSGKNTDRKRKNIFELKQKSVAKKVLLIPQNHEELPISVKLNIKQISDSLKKNKVESHDDKKILQKLSNLESIVYGIQNQVHPIQKRNQNNQTHNTIQTYVHQNERFSNSCQLDPHLLQMQLEQMKRCERIAKENQLLYGKLIQNIQNQSVLIHSTNIDGSTMKHSGNKRSSKRQVYDYKHEQSQRYSPTPSVHQFEDFDKFEFSQHRESLDEGQILQITSPFLIEQNKGSISINFN